MSTLKKEFFKVFKRSLLNVKDLEQNIVQVHAYSWKKKMSTLFHMSLKLEKS